jgi:hypothetical protein
MRIRLVVLAAALPLVLAFCLVGNVAPAQAASVVPPPAPASKIHDLSHPVYHVSQLGLTTPRSGGIHANAAFPGSFCINDTAYFMPLLRSRWYTSYALYNQDQFVKAQLWYLWCPASNSRVAPNGWNFSGGRIDALDGRCHTIGLGMPMTSDFDGHTMHTFAGATVLRQGSWSAPASDPWSYRTICPGNPLITWSGVADGRYNYLPILSVEVVLSLTSCCSAGTAFGIHGIDFE